ncbi:MAG: hypothetical protein AAF558_15445, partial [Verrucomicrobiota bacterium]
LDTAVIHYAWAMGVPFVQLFATTAFPERWAPNSGGTALLMPPAADTPEEVRRTFSFTGKNPKELSVKTVLHECYSILSSN